MKKIVVVLLILLPIITYIWFTKISNTKISNTKIRWTGNVLNFKVISLYDNKIPTWYTLPTWDLLAYQQIINDNTGYFYKTNDIEMFKIVRSYIFWEKFNDSSLNKLINCLNWKINYSQINNKEYSNICKWENKYIKKKDRNYFHIKDTLIKYKLLKEWKKINCNYFLWNHYKYNYKYENHEYNYHYNYNGKTYQMPWIFIEIYDKKVDYLICKKFENIKWYNLLKENYYFSLAVKNDQCSSLRDQNLVKLCKYKVNMIKKFHIPIDVLPVYNN